MPTYRARDITSPIVRQLEGGIEPEDLELARRLRSGAAGVGDAYVLSARLIRALERERESTDSQLQSQLAQALADHEADLRATKATLAEQEAKITKLQGAASTASLIVRGIFAAIGLFGLWGVDRILTRTEREGELTIRLQVIEKTLDRLVKWPSSSAQNQEPPWRKGARDE